MSVACLSAYTRAKQVAGGAGREGTHLVPNDKHQPAKPKREVGALDKRVRSTPPRQGGPVARHRKKKERERKEGRAEMWSGVARVEEAAAREKPSRGGSE